MSAPWVELVAAVIRGTPRLAGALCRYRDPRLFDGVTDDDADRAAAVRRHCSVLRECDGWALSLRHNERHGVLAGEYLPWVSHPSELARVSALGRKPS